MTTTTDETGIEDRGTFTVDAAVSDDAVTVWVAGELDVDAATAFGEALATAQAKQAGTLVIDVSGLQFIDSSGLHQLVRALRRQGEAGGEVVLRSPRPQTLRVLEIVGLTRVFTIV